MYKYFSLSSFLLLAIENIGMCLINEKYVETNVLDSIHIALMNVFIHSHILLKEMYSESLK